MNNRILYDAKGRPDIMVAFTPEELGLPATLKGRTVKEYMIAKYPFTLIEGVPYSLPFQQPATGIDFDKAVELCESKGEGWHLMTNDEWAAIANLCHRNGTIPRGNTNSGSSHSHPEEAGIKFEGGYGKTLTGSGPITWNHDHTAEGVADLVGNIWEWVGGLRFMDGQPQIIKNNGAADGADQSADSEEWEPILTADGKPIYFNVEDGDIRVQTKKPEEAAWDGTRFADLDIDLSDVPEELVKLGLCPPEDFDGDDYIFVDTDGERAVYRGGSWYIGSNYGVFCHNANNARTISNTSIGGRSAFICYSDTSDNLNNLAKDTKHPDEHKESDETLPDFLRGIMAMQIAKIAGTADGAGILKRVKAATSKELTEAASLLPIIAQNTIAEKLLDTAMKQAEEGAKA